MSDFIENLIQQSQNGKTYIVAAKVNQMVADGYTPDGILDILMESGYEESMITAALAAHQVRTATTERRVKVVPKRYRDMAWAVEASVKSLSSEEFVERLVTAGILKAEPKYLVYLNKAIKLAQKDPSLLSALHEELMPWMEEALLANVEAAESAAPPRIESASDEQYLVRIAGKSDAVKVDVLAGTCSCEKFQKYAAFGLACEHLVALEAKISPREDLERLR